MFSRKRAGGLVVLCVLYLSAVMPAAMAETIKEQALRKKAEAEARARALKSDDAAGVPAKSQNTKLSSGGAVRGVSKSKPAQAAAKGPVPGRVFRDCAQCPPMVVVPAGRFMMGSSESEAGHVENEGPVREVRIAAFAMGRYEVTQGEWKALMGDNPSANVECGDECPVEKVDWNRVQAYIRRLNEVTGKHYRLPSEAEWEYAARAGTRTAYWWGNEPSRDQANYGREGECCAGLAEGNDRWRSSSPVGSFPANPFGLYDMNGNVSEWTQDVKHDNYAGAPMDGRAWIEGGVQGARVNRGGFYAGRSDFMRSASRSWATPNSDMYTTGFRLALTLP